MMIRGEGQKALRLKINGRLLDRLISHLFGLLLGGRNRDRVDDVNSSAYTSSAT
jgi:hypothetical protein